MSVQEAEQVPLTAQQSTSGAQNVGTMTGNANSFKKLPSPKKMVCQDDLLPNWEFFKLCWMDCKTTTNLRSKESQ